MLSKALLISNVNACLMRELTTDLKMNSHNVLQNAQLALVDIINEFYPKIYKSDGETITSGGLLQLPHGLGVTPRTWQLYIKCTSAEQGYAIGDEVGVYSNNSTESTPIYNTIYVDSTNVNIRFSNNANCYVTGNKTTGAKAVLTNSKWDLYVEAEA